MATQKYEYFIRNFKWDAAVQAEKDHGFPIIRGCDIVPECLVSFTDRKRVNWPSAFLHTFKDDYVIDGVNGLWMGTCAYAEDLRRFRGTLSPDFSLYCDMDVIAQMWNVYRSRLVGVELESYGINVIPTVSWSDSRSFDFCFKGIATGGTVALSTVGVIRDGNKIGSFPQGVETPSAFGV